MTTDINNDLVSIICATNRLDDYACIAIDSLLGQTYRDIEIILIANGENCLEIASGLKEKYGNDSRVRVVCTNIPQLAFALNLGVSLSGGAYIARMDADDVCDPLRIERQIAYMRSNELDMVGCSVRLIDECGNTIGSRNVPQGGKIDTSLLFGNPFVHPTVIYKRDLFFKCRGYNAGFNSEDYDLWLRMRRLNVKWDNMSEFLLNYRMHGASTQRRILGYAEVAGLALREFILDKTFANFLAVIAAVGKALMRPLRS